jgi:5-oxoprolinase (ATP-hydrolysing) subunit C
MPSIHVLRPGPLTLVQDLGRPGHGASGVPRGGAFDPWATRAANRLVGNREDAALLEITLAGPTLELDGIAAIALVGDPFLLVVASGPELRPRIADRNATCLLQGTTRISISRTRSGARAWLALAGGIDVPLVLGSRSTDLAGSFGGCEGRALAAGDVLQVRASEDARLPLCRFEPLAEPDGAPTLLRLLPGPDEKLLAKGDTPALASALRSVSPHSDRRGLRLSGAPVELAPHAPLRSQGVLPGAVQIPPSGEPIVLGVDAPVTGGYPWVAQVIEADLHLLAHFAPGARVRFETVDFETAETALSERRRQLAAGFRAP